MTWVSFSILRLNFSCAYPAIDTIPLNLATQLQVTPGISLRDAHAQLINRELDFPRLYIFLTGNPGIGKTTAISDYLKSQKSLNEGFLLFYVSPRTQVNLDIIDKFIGNTNTKTLYDDRLITITTNDVLIKSNSGRCTVSYLSNSRQGNFTKKTVSFIDAREKTQHHANHLQSLKRTTEDRIKDVGSKQKGVLYSICEAIYTAIDERISNNIIAAVALQSLKVTQDGRDTLEHFEKIFKTAYNHREGTVISAEMQKISSRIKHIFIMIDEITGDEGGVEFLNRISSILQKYELTDSRHGFNTKIIVADASIVESSAIQQHLQEKSPEPNKIFFRETKGDRVPLSIDFFDFYKHPASIINSNSYPAKSLDITYKIIFESVKCDRTAALKHNKNLHQRLQSEIVRDIASLLEQPNSGQIIVYIQDKPRLFELIQSLRELRETFQLYKDYLEIHANLSEQSKREINQYKNNVKVIFMTASASRGLSFPKTKHILVDLPRFEVEKNLMEIIQVIYRGRGSYWENGKNLTLDNVEKELIFYLSERSITYGNSYNNLNLHDDIEEYQLALQESVLSILNIVLILKAAIMTRIFGYGQLGRGKFTIIPIGGKSVIAAGQTFSTKMNALIKQLKKEYNRQPSNQKLREVYISLEQLLSRAELVLRNSESSTELPTSYLAIREKFSQDFAKLINKNFEELLCFSPIETGYISGSLLIIPVIGILEENYEMRLEQEILKYADLELLDKLKAIKYDYNAPESLRSTVNEAIELVKLLRDKTDSTQNLEQNSQRCDRYYAIPLFAFLSSDALRQYFTSTEGEPEDRRFRDILEIYIRCLYPVGDILPIGHKYTDFPFIVFTSYSLAEMRNKIFTDKYLLNSHELNILSLILSRHTDD